jgi:hypothetical protein
MSFAGGATWSVLDLIERVLIGHALEHGKSIQSTVRQTTAA